MLLATATRASQMSIQGNDADNSSDLVPIDPIQPDFQIPRAYPIGLDPHQLSPSGIAEGEPYPLQNPGAIFDTPQDAAYDINSQMNGQSVADNTEYRWGYFRDPVTGKYGYTDPYNNGRHGGTENWQLTINGNLGKGVPLIGYGHTHGDYSDANGMRTRQNQQYGDTDNFSPGDKHQMDSFYNQPNSFTFFTVGTPSGQVLQYLPQNRQTHVLFDRSF